MGARTGDRVGVVRHPSGWVLPDGTVADLVSVVPAGTGDFDATVTHVEEVPPGTHYRFEGVAQECFDDELVLGEG